MLFNTKWYGEYCYWNVINAFNKTTKQNLFIMRVSIEKSFAWKIRALGINIGEMMALDTFLTSFIDAWY